MKKKIQKIQCVKFTACFTKGGNNMFSTKKIGIIIFGYPLGMSPMIINSAILLAQEGYEVHIFINEDSFELSKISFNDQNIIIHALNYNSGMCNKRISIFHKGKFKKIPIGNIYRYIYTEIMTTSISYRIYLLFNRINSCSSGEKLSRCTELFFIDAFKFHREVLNYIDNEYVCLVGIDAIGLITATLISIKKNVPVIYYNMELLLENECKTIKEKILKPLERECNKKSYLTVIQDKGRAKYLIEDNEIPEEKIEYLPVSALGNPYYDKSDCLYKTLGIARDKKILLYAGNIGPWSMSLEIAQAAQNWNDDMVLVLHSWRTDLDDDPYLSQIKNLTRNKKVYLSLNPVNWESLPELLSSADIGLIFYKNLGKNFYEIGSSSNKLALNLQVGLPIITIDYPSLREIIDGYKCGKCVEDPREIEKIANEIFSNYDFYKNNAFKCYQEKYEFSKHFKVVANRIKKLEN